MRETATRVSLDQRTSRDQGAEQQQEKGVDKQWEKGY